MRGHAHEHCVATVYMREEEKKSPTSDPFSNSIRDDNSNKKHTEEHREHYKDLLL